MKNRSNQARVNRKMAELFSINKNLLFPHEVTLDLEQLTDYLTIQFNFSIMPEKIKPILINIVSLQNIKKLYSPKKLTEKDCRI